jgi:hypothetical protein
MSHQSDIPGATHHGIVPSRGVDQIIVVTERTEKGVTFFFSQSHEAGGSQDLSRVAGEEID